jgi:wyosine [tRNA(Phe)-imidazoG37] synthetase (radical SAM superfamily)
MSKLLAGVKRFSETYPGDLIIETMLIKDVTDNFKELTQIADFIEQLHPQKSYLSLPTRPPAERWVTPVDEQVLNTAFQIFKSRGISVELLTHYEGNAFAFTGNVVEDLLSITSVHPMRKEGIERFLEKADVGWDVVETLIKTKKLIEVRYKESTFYLRKLPGKK